MKKIELGIIYTFTCKNRDFHPNYIVYGLVDKIDGHFVYVIPLNGFLGDQYRYYNVMNRIQRLINNENNDPNLNKPGAIISYNTTGYVYKKFLPFSRMIIEHILDDERKSL